MSLKAVVKISLQQITAPMLAQRPHLGLPCEPQQAMQNIASSISKEYRQRSKFGKQSVTL